MNRYLIAGLGLTFVLAGSAHAADPYFTADAIVKSPNGAPEAGKMYVGAQGTRFDFQMQGRNVTRIVMPGKGVMRILLSAQRKYIEYKIPKNAATAMTRPEAPCTASAQLECKMSGTEKLGSVVGQNWTIKPKNKAKAIKILWDNQRKMPLRETFPNGVSTQAVLLGTEKYESLNVERWERTVKLPNGQMHKSIMLYAPSLNTPVMEQHPGGMSRRMSNIKLGAPDAGLFDIPAGFSQMKPQQGPGTTGSVKTPVGN